MRSEANRVRGRNRQSRAKLHIILTREFWPPLNALLNRASMAALLTPLMIPATAANPTLSGEYRIKNLRSFIVFPNPPDICELLATRLLRRASGRLPQHNRARK